MKKLFLMLMLAVVAIAVSAQKGRVIDLPTDTITDGETIYITAPAFTSDGVVTFQALFTQLTGTAGGTATFEASVDGVSFVTLTDVVDEFRGYPAASLTVTDGAVNTWTVSRNNFYKYRIKYVGTGTQTVEVTSSYIRK